MLSLLYFLFQKQCSGSPGIVYKGQFMTFTRTISGLEVIYPFSIYFDFETTTSGIATFGPDNNEMYPVSFVIIFAFHPKLNLNRIIIGRRFGIPWKTWLISAIFLVTCLKIMIL